MKPEDSDVIKVYRKSASAKDFHLMSGSSSINTTLFVSNEIIRNFPLEADDLLIDVGCGDGTFLSLANKKVKNSVGVVTTQKELLRLERELPGLRFVVGLAQNLPFNTHYANKLVCNSVLLLLDKTNVKKALEEDLKPRGDITGINFFHNLQDDIEEDLESKTNPELWIWD